MKGKLQSIKVAVLLCDGFEETEMTKPREALLNAGATWQNKPVVIDKNIITSREPKDILVFNKAIIKQLSNLSKSKK